MFFPNYPMANMSQIIPIFPGQGPIFPGQPDQGPMYGKQRFIVDYGRYRKNQPGKARIRFGFTFPRPPIVVITPYWKDQDSQVSYVETISNITRNGFTVVSDNYADNYYVNWIAIYQAF